MHLQTLKSILVWVAVVCFTRVMTDDDLTDEYKQDLTNKLNMLVHHPGWRSLNDIRIKINSNRQITDPVSVILEAIASGRKPIDESNVMERYNEIWTVLRCKYAEVLYKFRVLIQHLIRICRTQKKSNNPPEILFRNYYNCFNTLFIKLQNMSTRFKCMTDAMEFVCSLAPQWKPRNGMIVAMQKLTDFTLTLGPNTTSIFSEYGVNELMVDFQIQSISDYVLEVFNNIVNGFATRNCNIPSYKYLTALVLNEEFLHKKRQQVIPQETTVLQYVEEEIDRFVTNIFSSCFYELGFEYDGMVHVTIRIPSDYNQD